MKKVTCIVRNSLILLACGAAIPTAWAVGTPASGTSQPAQPASGFSVPFQPSGKHVLDLKAPDIRDVMAPDDVLAATAIPPDDFDISAPATVAVRGAPQPVYVPSGFAALYWAAVHPLSAWRIIAPVQ